MEGSENEQQDAQRLEVPLACEVGSRELLERIKQLINEVREPLEIWTALSPSAAEKLAAKYQQRLMDWRSLLFSRSRLCHCLAHLSECEDPATLVDFAALEELSAEALADLDANEENQADIERQKAEITAEVKALQAEIPELFEKVMKTRSEQLEELEGLPSLLDGPEFDLEGEDCWSSLAASLRTQRVQAKAELDEIAAQTKELQNTVWASLLECCDTKLKDIRELQAATHEVSSELKQTDSILAKHFEILPLSKEEEDEFEGDDYEDLLKEEEALIGHLLLYERRVACARLGLAIDAQYDELGRIQYTISADDNPGLVGANIFASPATAKTWQIGCKPRLKQFRILWGPESPLPIDISIRADLGSIQEPELERAAAWVTDVLSRWKAKALKSPSIDIYSLFSVFLRAEEGFRQKV